MVLGLLLSALAFSTSPAVDERPPNFVVIVVDDLGWTDIGSYGSSFYETPNVDGLAASGLSFTSAYAACPVCSPSRAALMTGLYPQRVGITDYINQAGGNQPSQWKRKTALLPAAYHDRLPLAEVTIAEHLQQAGYATFFAGKWHLGPEGFWPEDQGFDVNAGGIDRGGPYGGKKYFSPYGNPRLEDGPEGEHLPDRLGRETVQFIEAHQDEPFLAWLSFYSVHTPLMARPDLEEHYQAKRAAGEPEAWGQEGERKVRLVQNHAVYAGMVTAMDQAVGQVLSALERLDLMDETVVVFTSDNGGLSTSEGHPTSNLPLRAGKGWLHEGGIRVPMIWRVPERTQAGSTSDVPVAGQDIAPTLLALAGLEAQAALDGDDLSLALEGEETDERPLFWHYPHYGNQGGQPGAAIRLGRFKLIEFFEDDRVELYDLTLDPGEANDLSTEQPERVKELRAQLDEWQRSVGAKYPTER